VTHFVATSRQASESVEQTPAKIKLNHSVSPVCVRLYGFLSSDPTGFYII
jgi:hypothetical protein